MGMWNDDSVMEHPRDDEPPDVYDPGPRSWWPFVGILLVCLGFWALLAWIWIAWL